MTPPSLTRRAARRARIFRALVWAEAALLTEDALVAVAYRDTSARTSLHPDQEDAWRKEVGELYDRSVSAYYTRPRGISAADTPDWCRAVTRYKFERGLGRRCGTA